MGAAGGSCGAGNAVRLASRHPEVKTLVLLAGGLMFAEEFLPKAPWMPVLAVAAHDDDDAVSAMRRVVGLSSAPESRLKEYAKGGHGTELFRVDKGARADDRGLVRAAPRHTSSPSLRPTTTG